MFISVGLDFSHIMSWLLRMNSGLIVKSLKINITKEGG
jgi:hypothetical protein